VNVLLQGSDELEEVCGTDSQIIEDALQVSDDLLHGLYDSLQGLQEYFYCRTFSPIYTTFTYQAICYSAVDGFRWSYAGMLGVIVCSMIMLTLRAAWYEIQEEPDETQGRRCCARLCCCCGRGTNTEELKDLDSRVEVEEEPNEEPKVEVEEEPIEEPKEE
jgi:hypothetical protein